MNTSRTIDIKSIIRQLGLPHGILQEFQTLSNRNDNVPQNQDSQEYSRGDND